MMDEKMAQWRDGLLSSAEMLTWLTSWQIEVINSMNASETIAAEKRFNLIRENRK